MDQERRARLEREDQDARRRCCAQLRGPVVLEAGAGTGKTAVLVARILAWALGEGWEELEGKTSFSEVFLAGDEVPEDLDGDDDEALAARVLEGIVAFTFTERAAGEMAERAAEWLALLAEGKTPSPLKLFRSLPRIPRGEELRRRARALSASVDRLAVGTIHGFCRRLLARYPLQAGRHPGRDEVDADGRLVEEVVQEVLGELLPEAFGEPADPDALALATDGVGPEQLASCLEALVAAATRPEALEQDPFAKPRVEAHLGAIAADLETLVEHLSGALQGQRKKRLDRALEALGVAQMLAEDLAAGVEGVEELGEILEGYGDGALANRLALWGKGRFSASEADALGAAVDDVEPLAAVLGAALAHLQALRPERLRSALRLLPGWLREVYRRLRTRGVTTFGALIRDARELLLAHPRVLEAARGMRQLLVDEFQDTDPDQCEVVRLLALEGPLERRPGLLVVGDPKQSIYGWRGADLAAYESFVASIEAQGGARLRLSLNFRSVAPILDEVEAVFSTVMRREAGLQPPFAPLVPTVELEETNAGRGRADGELVFEGDAGGAPWTYWVVPAEALPVEDDEGDLEDETPGLGEAVEEPLNSRQAREVEAAALVHDLVARQRRGELRWGDVAVLLRTTTHQELYLRALRRAQIPYLVERDRSYYRRREVVEAAAMLRTVLEPGDPVALLTLLRSAAVGVPDAALIPLWRAGLPALADELGQGPGDVERAEVEQTVAAAAAAMPAGIPGLERVEGWPLVLASTLCAIGAARRAYDEVPVDRWLQQLRARIPLEFSESGRFLGAHRLANLERFFTKARDALAEGTVDAAQLAVNLRRDVGGGREEQEAPVGDETLDAVRILTIHRAKGLTFEHVYVLGVHGALRSREGEGDEWSETDLGAEGRLLGASTLGYGEVLRRRKRLGAAEEVRTLYVALTRPRRRLVVSGRWSESKAPMAGSHLELLGQRPGAEASLAKALRGFERGDAREPEGDDLAQPHWRVLSGALRRQGLPTVASSSAEGDLRAASMAGELAMLAEERARAAAMMERPFTLSVVAGAELHGVEPDGAHDEASESDIVNEGTRAIDDDVVAVPAGPRPSEGEADQGPSALRRRAALDLGTLIHRTLEELVLDEPLGPQLRARLGGGLCEREGEEATLVHEALASWLPRLLRSRLLARLGELASHVLGREVPLIVAPEDEGGGAVGAGVGTIDLIYREPSDGRVVIVDYKTDRVPLGAVGRRAERHRAQAERYLEAAVLALGEKSARAELWFLWPDVVVDL